MPRLATIVLRWRRVRVPGHPLKLVGSPGGFPISAITQNVVTAALTAVALALSVISLRAWYHARSQKVLLLASGFVLFFLKGLVLTIGLFTVSPWNQLLLPSLFFDLGILVVFYVAVLK